MASTTALTVSEKEEIPSFIQELSAEDKQALRASSDSISSSTTTLNPASAPFTPGQSLQINARGIGFLRLPVSSSELEIAVTDSNENPIYLSSRSSRCSGNCVLSSPEAGDLIATEYFFGPGRDPVVTLLQGAEKTQMSGEQVKTTSKWISRSHSFILPNGQEFEWSYIREPLPAALLPDDTTDKAKKKKKTSLVLHEKRGKDSGDGKRLAQLVRTDETRTLGSRKCSAGNGGQLVLDVDAEKYLPEELVVASCLLMLKKEVDRRRAVQFAMIAGAASGGS